MRKPWQQEKRRPAVQRRRADQKDFVNWLRDMWDQVRSAQIECDKLKEVPTPARKGRYAWAMKASRLQDELAAEVESHLPFLTEQQIFEVGALCDAIYELYPFRFADMPAATTRKLPSKLSRGLEKTERDLSRLARMNGRFVSLVAAGWGDEVARRTRDKIDAMPATEIAREGAILETWWSAVREVEHLAALEGTRHS